MSFTTSGTSPIVVSTKDSSTSTVHISTKETSTSPHRSATAVASTSMEHVSLIDRGTFAQAVEKMDGAVNTTENFMVDAAVSTPPILSWQSRPPPLTFYPKPQPLTSQILQSELPVLSMQTSQAVSVEKKESAVNTTENVMVDASVSTPPILRWQSPPPHLTFYPHTQPLTSQNLQSELPALSQEPSQQPPVVASPTSKGQPRALSGLTLEEVLPMLSKQAMQELLTALRKQREPTARLNRSSWREPFPSQNPQMQPAAWSFQSIVQAIMHLALLMLTDLFLGCLFVFLQYSLLLLILQRCIWF